MDLILGSLAEGISYDEIKSEYGIKQDDIRAALAYASAALSGEEVLESPAQNSR